MSKHLLFYLFSRPLAGLALVFFLFSSSWSQTIWTKYPGNPVLQAGTTGDWDENFIYGPSALFKDGTYHLWYCTYLTTHLLTGYATSPDGITWTKYDDPTTTNPPYVSSDPVIHAGSPGEWDEEIVQPSVLWNENDSLFHMWYMAGTPAPYDARIGYATSPNGTTWTKYDDPTTTSHPFAESDPVLFPGPAGSWDASWVGGPWVLLIGNEYHMWYHAYQGTGNITRIGHATSHNGSTWAKDINNPVLEPNLGSWDYPDLRRASVVFMESDSLYHMFYSGGIYSLTNWQTGHATTVHPDSAWDKDMRNNPVVPRGPAGSWDAISASWCGVLVENSNQVKMWYTGVPDGQHAHIGYATSPVVLNVPGKFPTIQAAIDAANEGNIVLVEEGTYFENINFKGKAITVASRFLVDGDTSHISNTIIDGSQPTNPDSGSVVYFVSGEDTNSVLKGFTITGGTGTKYTYASTNQHTGGGLFIWSGGKIENNKIINNHLTNAGNRYTHGAGLEVVPDGNAIIRDNIIAHNTIDAWWGGGAGLILGCADNGYLLFENNRVINNTFNANGGHCVGGIGIFSEFGFQGPIYLKTNLIMGNQAYSTSANMALGGGIYIEHASPVLNNNIIKDNITNGWGGGINVSYWTGYSTIPANPQIINNTIYDNMATWGGGISIRGTNATPKMMNTILWGDSALLDDEINLTTGGDISAMYSDIEGGYAGEGNIDSNPLFHDSLRISGDTMYCCLPVNSPCIDAGHPHPNYHDPEDPINPGFALWPAMGTLRNDMGAHGGPGEPVVGIFRNNTDLNVPSTFLLSQNYPNPFNPSTTIQFDLPKASKVTLKVFNILGEEVVTLVSDRLAAGSYSYEWSTTAGIASGVYLYRLEAGNYVETRKMILIK